MKPVCWHCAEPLPGTEPFFANVAGVAHPVCCGGCRAAAEWIDQLGLADYYRLRSEPALRPDSAPVDAGSWGEAELARHVMHELPLGRREAVMLVDGIRCAACVWLIERALGNLAGIEKVQVNAAARRARMVWDPERCNLSAIIETFHRTGYRARPLDASAIADSRRDESRAALKRLVVAGFGAMQAMMYASALYFGAFETSGPGTRDLFRWLGLLVSSPVVFYSAQPFFEGAMRALRAGRLAMDVPVALAIALIYAASVLEALRGGGEVYFDSVSMFVFFLLLGRHLEMRARHRAGDFSDALANLAPAYADRLGDDGSSQRIAAVELKPGDRIRVAAGAAIPADCRLLDSNRRVDESLLSGESVPVSKQSGEMLLAGSLLLEGPVEMKVERAGADTMLAGMIALVARAQSERPRLALSGERAAARFVARVLALAALVAIGWSLVDPTRAFPATLAVLVVSCPCAFALAVPAALTRAMAVLAKRGVLVVRPDAIETLAIANHAVFDKTGTLSEPMLQVDYGSARVDAETALAQAAALARSSHHPVSRAITLAAAKLSRIEAKDVEEIAGSGVKGNLGERTLRLGHVGFALPKHPPRDELQDAVVLADEHGLLAAFKMTEQTRPGSRDAMDYLGALGISTEIVSGDAASRVQALAAQVGVTHCLSRQSPADKLERLRALRTNGTHVIVVGDGNNDAPLLAGADVSIAMGSGSDLAQASSDMVLSRGEISALPAAVSIARETMSVLRQNQRWALVYNLCAIPFAAFGFVPPWLAALGMSMSSLVVVLNATRVGRQQRAMTATDAREAVA